MSKKINEVKNKYICKNRRNKTKRKLTRKIKQKQTKKKSYRKINKKRTAKKQYKIGGGLDPYLKARYINKIIKLEQELDMNMDKSNEEKIRDLKSSSLSDKDIIGMVVALQKIKVENIEKSLKGNELSLSKIIEYALLNYSIGEKSLSFDNIKNKKDGARSRIKNPIINQIKENLRYTLLDFKFALKLFIIEHLPDILYYIESYINQKIDHKIKTGANSVSLELKKIHDQANNSRDITSGAVSYISEKINNKMHDVVNAVSESLGKRTTKANHNIESIREVIVDTFNNMFDENDIRYLLEKYPDYAQYMSAENWHAWDDAKFSDTNEPDPVKVPDSPVVEYDSPDEVIKEDLKDT